MNHTNMLLSNISLLFHLPLTIIKLMKDLMMGYLYDVNASCEKQNVISEIKIFSC